MSTVRITQKLMVERSMLAMQTAKERVSGVQEQLTTGRIVNRPSDSPTGTSSAMRLREQLAAGAQHARNASDGLAWLGRTDSTLTTMVDGVRRARDLILQGSNGALGAQARQAVATEVGQIRESMLALANTQHLGRPLFGGTTAATTAYTQDVAGDVTFTAFSPPLADLGQGQVTRRVGDNVTVRISTLGPEAFTAPGGTDLFAVLKDAVAALTDPNGTPTDRLADLDAVMKQMMTALADVGTRYGRVESALAAAGDVALDMQAMLSEVENVDIAKAAMDLQMQEVAYQSALAATARVIQPSLIDFLR